MLKNKTIKKQKGLNWFVKKRLEVSPILNFVLFKPSSWI